MIVTKKVWFFIFLNISLLIAGCADDQYYSLEDYASVSKADVHIHIRTHRNSFVEQALKDNFSLVNIVVDGAGTWEGVRNQFKYVKMQHENHPDAFRMITAVSVEDFHEPGWTEKSIAWLDSCFDQGAIGVKFWKNIGMVLKDTNGTNVMLDDARFDPIFDHIISRNKLVVGHLGEPYNCWLPLDEMTTNNDRSYFEEHPQYHMYNHPELPSYQDQIQARNRRLDKNPNLKFTAAHMASIEWNVDSLGAWFDKYPDATIDLAARMGQVFYQTQQDRERVRNFFLKYHNRITYATDLGDRGGNDADQMAAELHDVWMRDWTYFVTDQTMESDLVNGPFQGLKLPKEAVDGIFFNTAKRVFGF
ncbi:MAG: amidohydrolase family protein [Saprospiraceae bacterium]|nr:amidohydrolase family protein [Saprospiraceae bacterium]